MPHELYSQMIEAGATQTEALKAMELLNVVQPVSIGTGTALLQLYRAVKAVMAGNYTCGKCGHTWRARIAGEPQQCPTCKSKYWRVTV